MNSLNKRVKRGLLSSIIVFLFFFANGQIEINEGLHVSFDGTTYNVYQIEGKNVVLLINKTAITDSQLADTTTLYKILERCDGLYDFYKNNLGYEPTGGNPDFSFKTNIFFIVPENGGGLGLIGTKGIEISGFNSVFYNLKYDLNVNRDVIIGYELGRNFFTLSNKVLFPAEVGTDEKNGGFAEGFANVFYLYAFDSIMTNPAQRALNETLLNRKWQLQKFRGYINDDLCNPYNTLAKWENLGTADVNRGNYGYDSADPAYTGTSLLIGLIETFGKNELFPEFFRNLKECQDVVTIEDALSNIAYSASKALNGNLMPFFKNVLKFTLNSSVEEAINALPAGNTLAHSSQALRPGSSMSNMRTTSSNLSRYSRLASMAFLAA